MDNLLVELLVDEYEREIESFIPDIVAVDSDDPYNADLSEHKDSIQDFAADYIHDRECERNGAHCPEFKEAAKLIARHYCG